MSILSVPPGFLLRLVFKLPLGLYRVHLGWLFGHRLVRLTHRGRRTGQVRRTVIEVVRYDPRTREVIVMAAWGGRTDWYRNIWATPALEIRTGKVAYRPSQRFLTADETYQEMESYLRRNGWLARFAFPRLLGFPADAHDSQRRAVIGATLRGVAFRPRTGTLAS